MFKASLNRAGTAITFTETYSGPFDANPAGGTATQSHIHFGARAVAGGVSGIPVHQPRQRPGRDARLPGPLAARSPV